MTLQELITVPLMILGFLTGLLIPIILPIPLWTLLVTIPATTLIAYLTTIPTHATLSKWADQEMAKEAQTRKRQKQKWKKR